MEAIFSATPPLESFRALLARAASEPYVSASGHRDPDPHKVMLVDVSRAHFYAQSVRDVCIELPSEDAEHGIPGRCGKLNKTMCGTLDAVERWGGTLRPGPD